MPSARRLRVLWLMGGAFLLAAVLQMRLAYWQVGHHTELTAMARAQHEQRVDLPPTRGRLFDRNGMVLASNSPVYSIFASPDQIPARAKAQLAATLAPILAMEPEELRQRLESNTKFVYLRRRVPAATASKLDGLHLSGIGKLRESQRAYMKGPPPSNASLAAPLLGFVNDAGEGQYGVERYYDDLLRGRSGFEATLKDLTNRPIILSNHVRRDPVDGADLTLTLDSELQYLVEQALADGVKRAQAESGSAIVMHPRTGEILAWASTSGYDANAFRTTDPKRFDDPIVAHLYEPGSVMKVVTLAGALDAGVITPQTPYSDIGWVTIGGITINDWDRKPHRDKTMSYVLEQSLNVGAVEVMRREGKERFLQSLHAFGLGSPTGVDVAGEVSGSLNRPEWKTAELATATFGQGIAVTPLQMLMAVAAIANDGKLMWPHLRARSQDPRTGEVTIVQPHTVRPAVSPDAAHQMRDMMVAVVEKGSGFNGRIDGFRGRIAGKTGTAQVPENGKYAEHQVIGSFVGCMPAEEPRFCALVIMRKPKWAPDQPLLVEGAFVAAPVWREIAKAIVKQQRIP